MSSLSSLPGLPLQAMGREKGGMSHFVEMLISRPYLYTVTSPERVYSSMVTAKQLRQPE